MSVNDNVLVEFGGSRFSGSRSALSIIVESSSLSMKVKVESIADEVVEDGVSV